MEIRKIEPDSKDLDRVIQLWRSNSATLGFFPRGAFDEHARRGRILGAFASRDNFAGYLLYRVTHRGAVLPRAIVVHICVHQQYRGQGVARVLVERLVQEGRHKYLRVELKCRRDFEAHGLWPSLGFHAVDEIVGQSGKPLVKWHMPLVHPPLFEVGSPAEEQELYRLVIDANVFFRLEDPGPEAPPEAVQMSIEAKALYADWLPESLGIYVTDELLNEIERNDDADERSTRRVAARRYKRLTTDIQDVLQIERAVLASFSEDPTERTRSDTRQLAHAIAGQAHFFVTQDHGLLKKAQELQQSFPISVVSPGEFIAFLDESLREVDYRPARVAGVRELYVSRASAEDMSELYDAFRCNETGERKGNFNHKIRRFLSRPDGYTVLLVRHRTEETPLLLKVSQESTSECQRIPVLRISTDPLARTVLRHSLFASVLHAARRGVSITLVGEECPNPAIGEALTEIGFRPVQGGSARLSLNFAGSLDELVSELEDLLKMTSVAQELVDNILRLANDAAESNDLLELAELERLLWPAKILDAPIPTYLVPIRPQWAQHLFDEEIAGQTLWGAREHLALNVENVYYRSAKTASAMQPPSRLLWYVSQAPGFVGVKQIRACSRLDEVHIDAANELYKRFSRLGVYEWGEVLRTADGDPGGSIMALRFSNTELLPRPIPLSHLEVTLRALEGKAPMLQGPTKLEPATFASLYKYASALEIPGE